jgi:hypothetical protein
VFEANEQIGLAFGEQKKDGLLAFLESHSFGWNVQPSERSAE